jgi:hypothetical protein
MVRSYKEAEFPAKGSHVLEALVDGAPPRLAAVFRATSVGRRVARFKRYKPFQSLVLESVSSSADNTKHDQGTTDLPRLQRHNPH